MNSSKQAATDMCLNRIVPSALSIRDMHTENVIILAAVHKIIEQVEIIEKEMKK